MQDFFPVGVFKKKIVAWCAYLINQWMEQNMEAAKSDYAHSTYKPFFLKNHKKTTKLQIRIGVFEEN